MRASSRPLPAEFVRPFAEKLTQGLARKWHRKLEADSRFLTQPLLARGWANKPNTAPVRRGMPWGGVFMKAESHLKNWFKSVHLLSSMFYTFFYGSLRISKVWATCRIKGNVHLETEQPQGSLERLCAFFSFCPHRLKQTKRKTKSIRSHVEQFHLFRLKCACYYTVHRVKCPHTEPASTAPVHIWACPCLCLSRLATCGTARDIFKLRYEVLNFFLWICFSLRNLLHVSENT